MKEIKRHSMLYKTGVEYGDYTMNHVLGCSHGCRYPCYAFMQKKRFGVVKTYSDWCEPKLVSNTCELLDSEIPRLKDKIKSVFLCFSTDPFMFGYDKVGALTIEALARLNCAGIKCTVLTKGILPLKLAEFSPENEYGITLVSLKERFRQQYEPNTADYQSRIAALKSLHDNGCRTWVSMEPYPTPNICGQSMWNILEVLGEISFVDKIVFGKLNYNPLVKEFPDYKLWYNARSYMVEDFCRRNDITFYCKQGTRSPEK